MIFSTEPPSIRQLSSSPRANEETANLCFATMAFSSSSFSQLLRSLGYQCARRSSSIGRDTISVERWLSTQESSSTTTRLDGHLMITAAHRGSQVVWAHLQFSQCHSHLGPISQ